MASCVLFPLALALVLAWAGSSVVQAAPLKVSCETLTKIESCIECTTAGGATCQLCSHTSIPVWSVTGKITKCNPAVEGVPAAKASGDPKCLRADGPWCVTCVAGHYFNDKFQCVATGANGELKTPCQNTSKNKLCTACNPDGTCKACPKNTFLIPTAAVYINVPGHESMCMAAPALVAEARQIGGVTSWALIPNCVEYTNDFKCAHCAAKFYPTKAGDKCIPEKDILALKQGCPAGLRYREYCTKCAGNKCLECGWGRMLLLNECRVNCKHLFGIGCVSCKDFAVLPTTTASFVGSAAKPGVCSGADPLYANGRR